MPLRLCPPLRRTCLIEQPCGSAVFPPWRCCFVNSAFSTFGALLCQRQVLFATSCRPLVTLRGSFVQAVLQDMRWLGDKQHTFMVPLAPVDVDALAASVAGVSKAQWKRAIATAVKASVEELARSADSDPYQLPVQNTGDHVCIECWRSFRDQASLASHRHRQHQVKNPIRRHIRSVTCECCLKLFHTRERMVYHSGASAKCRCYLLSLAPLSPDEADELDQQAASTQTANRRAGHTDRKAHAAAYRVAGPRPCAFYRPLPPPAQCAEARGHVGLASVSLSRTV